MWLFKRVFIGHIDSIENINDLSVSYINKNNLNSIWLKGDSYYKVYIKLLDVFVPHCVSKFMKNYNGIYTLYLFIRLFGNVYITLPYNSNIIDIYSD